MIKVYHAKIDFKIPDITNFKIYLTRQWKFKTLMCAWF